jgi:hypothetical protein
VHDVGHRSAVKAVEMDVIWTAFKG